MLEYFRIFQEFHPEPQPFFLLAPFRRGRVRRAATNQHLCVDRLIKPCIQHRGVLCLGAQVQSFQEAAGYFLHPGKAVRITFPVSQHDVVLGIDVIVASIFAEHQPINE